MSGQRSYGRHLGKDYRLALVPALAATNLRSLGVDVKTAQELLRHANSRTTLYPYTRAISSEKPQASGRQLELLIGGSPSVPSSVPSGREAIAS